MTEAKMIDAKLVIEAIVASRRNGGMSFDGHQLATRLVEHLYAAGVEVSAEGLPEPSEPHYVIRHDAHANGPASAEYGLVSVAAWNNGLSRAISDRVCDADKQPLVVYPAEQPVVSHPAVTELAELLVRLDRDAEHG